MRESVTKYVWLTAFAEINTYKNKNISNLSLTKDGISFHYKNHFVIIDPARFSDPGAVFLKKNTVFFKLKIMM